MQEGEGHLDHGMWSVGLFPRRASDRPKIVGSEEVDPLSVRHSHIPTRKPIPPKTDLHLQVVVHHQAQIQARHQVRTLVPG